jgi:hypothetical protein
MGFLGNLFGRKKRAPESAQKAIAFQGEQVPVVTSQDALFAAFEQHRRVALRFRAARYTEATLAVVRGLRQRHGESSHPYESIVASYPIVCARCLFEFPGSYKLLLAMQREIAERGAFVAGAAPGATQFGKSGKCPQCGSQEALLICQWPRE